ncbi:MAG: TetR/AcrR family transcriptional regulator [Moraxellaceae bacterium]
MTAITRPTSKSARAATSTSRNYGGEGLEQRKLRRRAQFIEAGKALFGSVGYRKTTMRLLCKEAELTDRYFYESFETTEDLLVAVYEQLIGELLAELLKAISELEPERDVDRLIGQGLDAFFRFAQDPVASRIVWLEILGISPRVDALYNGTLRRFADILLGLTRTAIPSWDISDDVAGAVAMGMIGAVSELAKDWLMAGYAQPRPVLVEGASMIFRGMAGVSATKGKTFKRN